MFAFLIDANLSNVALIIITRYSYINLIQSYWLVL